MVEFVLFLFSGILSSIIISICLGFYFNKQNKHQTKFMNTPDKAYFTLNRTVTKLF